MSTTEVCTPELLKYCDVEKFDGNGNVEMFCARNSLSPPSSDDADGSGPVSNNQNNERLDSKNTSSMHLRMHLKGYFLT